MAPFQLLNARHTTWGSIPCHIFQSSSASVSESLEVCGVSSIKARWLGKGHLTAPLLVFRVLKWNAIYGTGPSEHWRDVCVSNATGYAAEHERNPSVNSALPWYGFAIPSEHGWYAVNSVRASSGTNTRDFMCFLFWLLSLPLIQLPVHRMFVREGSPFETLSLTTFWKVATSLW